MIVTMLWQCFDGFLHTEYFHGTHDAENFKLISLARSGGLIRRKVIPDLMQILY